MSQDHDTVVEVKSPPRSGDSVPPRSWSEILPGVFESGANLVELLDRAADIARRPVYESLIPQAAQVECLLLQALARLDPITYSASRLARLAKED
jgi:hypothetical protein